eukprot:1404787-Pyramimonas_sp.AAC.1
MASPSALPLKYSAVAESRQACGWGLIRHGRNRCESGHLGALASRDLPAHPWLGAGRRWTRVRRCRGPSGCPRKCALVFRRWTPRGEGP